MLKEIETMDEERVILSKDVIDKTEKINVRDISLFQF
jgi:hypothetical protein